MPYISKEKYKELEKELKYLETEKRQEIAKRLKEAKELGDLSENSEYTQAREDEEALERRIVKIKQILTEAEIIKDKKRSKGMVEVGSTIKVQIGKDKKQYTIVGSEEANVLKGLISNDSPLGKAFLGRKKGDEVEVKTPSGKRKYKIIDIS